MGRIRMASAAAVITSALLFGGSSGAVAAPHQSAIIMEAAAYTPLAPPGSTDDYHCTLVDPHVTQNSFIVSSQFFPGTGKSVAEVHHAILFMVPPELAKAAETANNGGKGWTCFGEPPVLGKGRQAVPVDAVAERLGAGQGQGRRCRRRPERRCPRAA